MERAAKTSGLPILPDPGRFPAMCGPSAHRCYVRPGGIGPAPMLTTVFGNTNAGKHPIEDRVVSVRDGSRTVAQTKGPLGREGTSGGRLCRQVSGNERRRVGLAPSRPVL